MHLGGSFVTYYSKLLFSLGDQFAVCNPSTHPLSFHRAKYEPPSLNGGIFVEMNSYGKTGHCPALTDSRQMQFNTKQVGNTFSTFLRHAV